MVFCLGNSLRELWDFFQKFRKYLRSQITTHIFVEISEFMNLRRDVFQAIADPTRRVILLLVASQAMTAGAIAANFNLARPTVSKHLQILTECELLKQEHSGREIYYHLNPSKIKEIADFIEPFRNMWDDRFNTLEAIMKKHKPKK